MGCIISLFRYGTFWPPVVPHATNRTQRTGNDPDTIAATKIQAGFRGYKTRQELQKAAKSKLTDEEIARRLKPPLSTIKEEEEAAAVKIQAGVRGYLTRKRIKQSLDYSFDDGFGMGSIDGGELSANATPEPPHEMPIIAADIHSVPPKSISPVLSVQSESKVATPVEPEPVAEEEIAENLPVASAEVEPTAEPVLSVSIQETSVEAKPVISELQQQENIYEIGMLDEVPVDEPVLHIEASLPSAEPEPEIMFIDSETVVPPAIPELVPELESIDASKSAELSSLPLAQVGVNTLIGVFETPNPEPVAVSEIQHSEPKIPDLPSPESPVVETEPDLEPQFLPKDASDSFSEPSLIEASDTPALDAAEPPVQRRSSKRKMKAGTEKYRSGIVIQNEVPVGEQMHIPSLDEIDAEIEAEMLNNAAAKIQAGFRGFQVRKGLNQAATRIQSNYRGYKTRKELRDKALAAVKIQATVRGFLARRRIHNIKYQQQRRKSSARRRSSAAQNQLRSQAQLRQSIEAATRIQAAYRGYIVRSKKREFEALQ